MKATSLSAGAIVIRKVGKSKEYLLLRCFKYWDFPKGMVEENEDPWVGALREVQEETGLKEFLHPLQKKFYQTEAYGKGKVARYYLLESTSHDEIKILPNPITGIIEHHEYRWVSYDEALSLVVPRIQRVIDWAEKHLPQE